MFSSKGEIDLPLLSYNLTSDPLSFLLQQVSLSLSTLLPSFLGIWTRGLRIGSSFEHNLLPTLSLSPADVSIPLYTSSFLPQDFGVWIKIGSSFQHNLLHWSTPLFSFPVSVVLPLYTSSFLPQDLDMWIKKEQDQVSNIIR